MNVFPTFSCFLVPLDKTWNLKYEFVFKEDIICGSHTNVYIDKIGRTSFRFFVWNGSLRSALFCTKGKCWKIHISIKHRLSPQMKGIWKGLSHCVIPCLFSVESVGIFEIILYSILWEILFKIYDLCQTVHDSCQISKDLIFPRKTFFFKSFFSKNLFYTSRKNIF